MDYLAAVQMLFGWLKLAVIGFLPGWLAGTFVAFQIPDHGAWYESPPAVAALVTAVSLLVYKLIDRKYVKDDRRGETHLSITGQVLSLTTEERDRLLGGLKALHKEEILFEKKRRAVKEVEAFEARWRAHRAVDELNRVHLYIFTLHHHMSEQGIVIPEFKLKNSDDLMIGLEEAVAGFKKTLTEAE